MNKILITGSAGFIGSHLVNAFSQDKETTLFQFDVDNSDKELFVALDEVDYVFHLAGVNRPKDEIEFTTGNVDLTKTMCDYLIEMKRTPKIILSSSTQAESDNPYGASKKAAEEVLQNYHNATNAEVVIYRLPNAFGKWSRPNYNTVIATFCHNIARNLPIQISDVNNEVTLVYIDDIVAMFKSEINGDSHAKGFRFADVNPVYRATLGDLADTFKSFKSSRESLYVPEMGDDFTKKLYATYLSFLDGNDFSYQLKKWTDERGSLAEFVKSPHIGQMFVSRTKPGITRGDHYHHTKVEKFLVLEGQAVIRFRKINSDEILSYPIDGKDFKVVDIPPGYTHSIENVGATDMVVLFWAGEIYNPDNADTIYLPVLS